MANKILILGGGFDPPHQGHIEPPLFVRNQKGFDTLVFVPTGVSPHKRNKKMTDNATRKRMLELSLEGISGVEIDTFEMEQSDVVYFYQTLEHLREKYSGAIFSFLIGSDWISKLDRWKKWSWIKTVATPICMVRPGYNIPEKHSIEVVEVPSITVSSTFLREKLSQGLYEDEIVQKNIRPNVLDFIRDKKIYNVTTTLVR